MSIEGLRASLADRYRIERELGAGGMATVYLAHDLKHDRDVAIKVLRPELAAAVGAERFLREIKVTANLRHAHILPLYDSGTATVKGRGSRVTGPEGGTDPDDAETCDPGPATFLYYVMPYIEGETLRDRMDREKQLPLDDALRVAGEVADALSYAHGKGVIHRDIKPENILLENGHAIVADFGIARALSTAGAASLTETGMAIGTPAYMSPEQASGEQDLDGRTDCYALGCVTYEMLAGQPPFLGPTAQSIVHQHLAAAPRPVTEIRSAVPAPVADAIQRALAKAPADRFATLGEFSAALRTGEMASRQDGRMAGWRDGGTASRRVKWAVAVAALLVVAWFGRKALRAMGPTLDPDVIAVLPFRVGGPNIEYLRESMLDLLQARLSSATGPRTVEPRTLLAAWRRSVANETEDLSEDASRTLARDLGAGRVLLGSAIATPTELTLSGTLIQVGDGTVLARENVVGAPDSVAVLVNRLTAGLLIRGAGEAEERQAGLAAEPLDALQNYLAGRKAYRRGDYFGAMDLYGRAVARDSDFVQAAFSMAVTNAWIGTVATAEGYRMIPRVWQMRDRLNARDRGLLLALPMVGPAFPAPSNYHQIIAQAAQAAEAAPDSPDHWLLLGQLLNAYGAVASEPRWEARTAESLDRAIALDSSFAAATATRLYATLQTPDRAATARYYALMVRQVEAGASDDGWLWAAARTLGDSTGAVRWRDHIEPVNARLHRSQKLVVIPLHSAAFALPLEDAHWAVTTLRREATTERERNGLLLGDLALHFAEGRLAIDGGVWEQIPGPSWIETFLEEALIEPAYRGAAIERLRKVAAATRASPGVNDCFGALLRKAEGEAVDLRTAIRHLDAAGGGQQVCAALLGALLEEEAATGRARPALDRLDSLMHDGPRSYQGPGHPDDLAPTAYANFTIARLRERQGDIPAALAAIRRREVDYFPYYLWNLPAFLRQEGRLAALARDTVGARIAYDKYLTLRSDPDPPFRAQRDSVIVERARLSQSPR